MLYPCRYSAGGKKSYGTYWTIHITLEPEFMLALKQTQELL